MDGTGSSCSQTPLPGSSLPGMVATAVHEVVSVVEQVQLARDTWRLRLACPSIAQQVTPGQFFMLRSPHTTQPLLGRPFALYDTYLDADGQPAGIDVVYLVVGRMTSLMQTWRPGDDVEIWGPLGNGFPVVDSQRLLLVAGGIGNTPFLATAREALALRRYGSPARKVLRTPDRVTFCYGARSADYFAGLDDFTQLGPQLELQLATDDGSRGHHGFVTDLVREQLTSSTPSTAIYCCGPEKMMHRVAELALEHHTPCWLSLETPMACGFGACFSCVTRVRLDEDQWDYRRVCVEGPIFPAEQLVW